MNLKEMSENVVLNNSGRLMYVKNMMPSNKFYTFRLLYEQIKGYTDNLRMTKGAKRKKKYIFAICYFLDIEQEKESLAYGKREEFEELKEKFLKGKSLIEVWKKNSEEY